MPLTLMDRCISAMSRETKLYIKRLLVLKELGQFLGREISLQLGPGTKLLGSTTQETG